MLKKIFHRLKYKHKLGCYAFILANKIYVFFKFRLFSDQYLIEKKFLTKIGYAPDLKNPKTYNEKINWLKLHDRRDLMTDYADKVKARNIIAQNFGAQFLIPHHFITCNVNDIQPENLPDYPFIIKPNHGSGWLKIVWKKELEDWQKIRTDCHIWLAENYYYKTQEWQYKNILPQLIVEKLLVTKEGELPNNYRFHCFSGRVEFISVTIYKDNHSNVVTNKYDTNWQPLHFSQGEPFRNPIYSVPKPTNFNIMCSISKAIAKQFAYVRIDFYEIDGMLYFSEVTLHDSGGYEKLYPEEWDLLLGQKIELNRLLND